MRIFSLVICFFIATMSFGQSFISPLENAAFGQMKSAIVQLKNGTEVTGVKFSSYMVTSGHLASFTLKKENGEKEKFKAKNINTVKIEPNEFAKTMMRLNSPNLIDAIEKDYSAIDTTRYVTFEQVEVKKGKFKLLQLLNPGLDERIKVYLDPYADKSMNIMGIVGGEDRSYFVKKADESFRLKKGKYKNFMVKLFSDNEKMMELIKSDKIDHKFKNFAGHIAIYNESF